MSKGRRAAIALCCLTLVACIAAGICLALPYLQAQNQMNALRSEIKEDSKSDVGGSAANSDSLPTIDWKSLQAKNPDICGWLLVPGTAIDYPVVAAPAQDPERYLHHDLSGKESVAGVPYLDVNCRRDWSSKLSAVYGHHLADGSMFTDFAKYSNEEYFNEHRVIFLMTSQETLELTAVAANVIDAEKKSLKLEFDGRNDFSREWQHLLSSSEVIADDAPERPERSFIFSTCSYQTANSRTLVLAVEM